MNRLPEGTPFYRVPGLPGRHPVVVLHELFGISSHVKEVCHRLAAAGHEAIAPDLFAHLHGLEGKSLPETDDGRAAGFALLSQLSMDDVIARVSAAIDATGASSVNLLGLSVGGHLGYRLPEGLSIRRAVHVYPGWLDSTQTPLGDGVRAIDSAPPSWPTLVIGGEDDPLIRPDSRIAIAAHLGAPGSPHQLLTMESVAHGFLASHRLTHHAAATATVWERILEWFEASE